MDATSPRWQAITDSEFPWERDALAFVRDRLPDHEPYRAWSNFEFIADDGSINEVDLLVLTPKGFYLVEIKNRPGIVEGDQGTWRWRGDGPVHTVDNPLLLANRKAKKLISLLRRQPALQRKASTPFLEAHVFLSHENVDCRVAEELRDRVHLRDAGTGRDERPGIVAALIRHSAGTPVRTRPDRPTAKAVSRAMQEAGIRPSQRARHVGDYRLDELLLEGPSYQDWTARHAAIDTERARVRIYAVSPSAADKERETCRRAARREYEILRDVRHEGILAAKGYTEHVLGPALVFEHRDGSQRFDHWLAERAEALDVDARLHLLRQIAEAVHFAHAKHLVHRALSPQSILVVDPEAPRPRVRIFNWQTGAREAGDTGASGPATSGASRLDAFRGRHGLGLHGAGGGDGARSRGGAARRVLARRHRVPPVRGSPAGGGSRRDDRAAAPGTGAPDLVGSRRRGGEPAASRAVRHPSRGDDAPRLGRRVPEGARTRRGRADPAGGAFPPRSGRRASGRRARSRPCHAAAPRQGRDGARPARRARRTGARAQGGPVSGAQRSPPRGGGGAGRPAPPVHRRAARRPDVQGRRHGQRARGTADGARGRRHARRSPARGRPPPPGAARAVRRRPPGHHRLAGAEGHSASRHQAGESRHRQDRQAASPRAVRLLARAHPGREHPGGHARLPRPVPADAEAAAAGTRMPNGSPPP